MPTLPTVLVTDIIRSADTGGSHGGAYLVNLDTGTWDKVLDWNDPSIEWEGRGSNRGLRGIAFHNGEVYIAASNEVFVFGQDFKIRRSYKSKFLSHAHEVFLHGDRLHVTSTLFDSILTLDLTTGEFVEARMFRLKPPKNEAGLPVPGPPVPRIVGYDPRAEAGPKPNDTVHLNSVWAEEGRLYFCGVRMRNLLFYEGNAVRRHAPVPEWTHNARPFKGGVLANSTGEDCICHFDAQGVILKKFPVPRYDEASLTNVPTGKDIARQAFGRGLVTTDDGLVIGGSSPSTVTVYDWETCAVIRSINLTMDVRNAPHGLAVWPY